MNRRGFLGAILAAGVAPAVVRAANIMPVFMRSDSGLILPSRVDVLYGFTPAVSNSLLTISMITKEALMIVEKNLIFTATENNRFFSKFR